MRFRPADSTSPMRLSFPTEDASDSENVPPNSFNTRIAKGKKGIPKDSDSNVGSPRITPVKKKYKPQVLVQYPEEVPIPSKSLICALYSSAVGQDDSHQNELDEAGCGLLSMEEVLLPAVAREETNVLKELQAKAQRDSPETVNFLKQSRRAVYESIESGIVAAREARIERKLEENEHRRQTEERQRLKQEEKLKELQRGREKRRQEKKEQKRLEMKKQLPKNMEMWQEVAFLMTELAKMKKEERMWIGVEKELGTKEEGRKSEEEIVKAETAVPETAHKPPYHSNASNEIKERVESAMRDINLSSLRIKRAAAVAKEKISGADQVRSEIFKKYTRDHQFHGYTGIRDPKSLIRILSQD